MAEMRTISKTRTALKALGLLAATFAATTSFSSASSAATQWVMGFYAAQQKDLLAPSNIDWSALTHIIVGPVEAKADGTLDTDFTLSGSAGETLARDIAARAGSNGKKALLSITGAGLADAVKNKRAELVAAIDALVDEYEFDGVDINWTTKVDNAGLLLLVTDLDAALSGKVLTVQVPPISSKDGAVDENMDEIAAQVDRMIVRTFFPYTMPVGTGYKSWHSSALDGETNATPYSIQHSLNAYDVAGVAASKLVMGIGFSGACYTGRVTAPQQSVKSSVARGGWADFPLVSLYGTNGSYSSFTAKYDATASVPYLSLANPQRHACRYVTFEDEKSLLAKGAFSRGQGYGGAMLWTINGGRVPSHSRPNFLFDSVEKGFLNTGLTLPLGLSILQGNIWVKPGTYVTFRPLITGQPADRTINLTMLKGCGTFDVRRGLYRAPAKLQVCDLDFALKADAAVSDEIEVTITNTAWTPKLTLTRTKLNLMDVKVQNSTVNAVSIRLRDGRLVPLTLTSTEAGTNYPIFTSSYNLPGLGGSYSFLVRRSDNRASTVIAKVPRCNADKNGVCK